MDPVHKQVLAFGGRLADRNGRAIAGARLIGEELARRVGAQLTWVGGPNREIHEDWEDELAAGRPALREFQVAHAAALAGPAPVLTALPRCTGALATLPNIAHARPDALVVWCDAHADLNTPGSSTSGYLGGMVISAPLGWWDSGMGEGLTADNLLLVGVRDLDPYEQHVIDQREVRVVAGPNVVDDLGAMIGDKPIYLHLDCDVLEPGIVPAQYPVEDGLGLAELHDIATCLAHNEVVGVEIAEFEAPDDPAETATVVRNLLDALGPLWDGGGLGHVLPRL